MAIYLKKFENHTQYENYINGSGAILPNVSICTTEGDVHYNPYVEPIETRVVAKFNVIDTSNPTSIIGEYAEDQFIKVEIDGVEQPSVTTGYTFSTTGEHTVKYTLTDPTIIGESAFEDCSSLTSVTIPNSVTGIGGSAFYNCSSLTSIDIPNSVTSIGERAFEECGGLTSCTIGSGVTTINDSAFYYCTSLTSIDIPNSVTTIGDFAFCDCGSLSSITIGSGVTTIGDNAFYNSYSLTSIDIPNSVTSIGEYAFGYCGNLISCTIGSGITSIGNNAFGDCVRLINVTILASVPPTIDYSTFDYIVEGRKIYVPSGSVNTYKTASEEWEQYAEDIEPIQ